MKVKSFLNKIFTNPLIQRFIKFAVVGAISFIIDNAILGLQIQLIESDWFVRLIAPVISFEFGVLNNYMWYHHWVWKDRRKESVKEYWIGCLHYNMTIAASLVIKIIIMNVLIESIGFFRTNTNHYIIANMIGVLVAAFFSFFIVNKFIFKQKKE